MNCSKEISAFSDWLETHSLDTASIALWYTLVSIANKAGNSNDLAVTSLMLCAKTGLNEAGLYRARNKLIKAGRITVTSPGGKNVPLYTIICLASEENTDETQPKNKQNDSVLAGETVTLCREKADETQTKNEQVNAQMSNKERKEEDERERKERSKEKRERGEEEKKEIIPLTPLRGNDLPDGNTVSLSPSGEILATEELPKSNIVLVYPDRTSQTNGKAKLEDGKGKEEREKKVSRPERKEKEAATEKKPARSKYFLSLAEAHRLIKTRVGNKSPSLAEAMCEWATMRYAIRGKDCRLTERAIKQAFDFLNNCNYRETQAVACVQQSIDQHWLGLYELKAAPDR